MSDTFDPDGLLRGAKSGELQTNLNGNAYPPWKPGETGLIKSAPISQVVDAAPQPGSGLEGIKPTWEPTKLAPTHKLGNSYPLWKIVDPQPRTVLKIGVNTAVPAQCLEVVSLSGVKIADMTFDGVITSYVEDPVKELNEMLESDTFSDNYLFAQLRTYLLLLRSYFSLPQPDSWRKNPLL